MDGQRKGTRRRGKILEEAILLAAWRELAETGYTNLTMESVAVKAGTNKAVLYRRWAGKVELVIAAMHRYLPKITDEIPNTGNLRDDVCDYLRARVEPLKTIGAETIRGLIMEPVVWHIWVTSIPKFFQGKFESKLTKAMMTILKNAELRGEIKLTKLNPRIVSLPLDLLQYELITKMEPISDEAIAEIVDDIFMPLIHAAQ